MGISCDESCVQMSLHSRLSIVNRCLRRLIILLFDNSLLSYCLTNNKCQTIGVSRECIAKNECIEFSTQLIADE